MSAPEITPEYRKAVLAELVQIGLDMARGAGDDSQVAETPQDRARAALAYDRAARAIRHALAFEDLLAQAAARAAQEAEERATRDRDARREQVRARVHRRVHCDLFGRFDDDAFKGGEAPEQLNDLLYVLKDRLRDDVLDPAILDLPFEDVVARIKADLGLSARAVRTKLPAAGKGTTNPRPRTLPPRRPAAVREPPPPPPPPPPILRRPDPPPPPEAVQPEPPRILPPPDPEPHVPPWERLRPGQRFPGGSGY